ncbi:cysteine hydrolase family protein [Dermatobacter hominis]|uniref:cysteine hydrolase family protein n=1 Tax=Dermatobacter hominis TaxID=2884263 RepID=UPI001D128EDA|nr:isochorismatase family protein [Dermatobacter hominis]UDY37266.1 isochorismatase family protein [Dermatobacter hominis]
MTTIPSTEPYPWPWDGAFDPTRLALVVTGVQRAHAEASLDVPTAIDRIEELSGAVRRSGGIVCHVRHTSPAARPRPLLPEVGMEAWAPVLRPGPEDVLVSAAGHDGFFGSSLDQELRSRRRDLLVVVGLAAEVTVSCTVRSANDRGYECLTPIDVSAPLDPWTSEHELHSVTMSGGIFGAIGPVAPLLESLQQHRSAAPAAASAPSRPEPSPDHEPALEESA